MSEGFSGESDFSEGFLASSVDAVSGGEFVGRSKPGSSPPEPCRRAIDCDMAILIWRTWRPGRVSVFDI